MSSYWYLFILALCGFVTSFGAHIVATNLPPYAEAIGAGALMIGLLIAVYDFAELFAKPMAGFVADRRGMKPTLLVGLGIFIAGSLLFLVVNPKLLLLVRFIQGLGAAALSTVSISLVAKYFELGRGKAFGVYNAIKGAGYVIAPAVGGFLISGFGFGMIFKVSAAVGALALLLSLFLPSNRTGKDVELKDDNDDLSLREFFLIFKEPRLLPIYAVIGTSMGAAQSFKEFGDMVGPLLIGALTQVFGVRTGFVSCGVLALVLLLVLGSAASRNPQRAKP